MTSDFTNIQLHTQLEYVRKIADILTKEAFSVEAPGLMYGQMGIVIFFLHYARYTDDKEYENRAFELIDEIQKKISRHISSDYGHGFAGIGTGIEYMAQNGFADAATDEILSDIDSLIIYQIIYREHTDLSLLTGLSGLGRYLLTRISNLDAGNRNINALTNRIMLIHVVDLFERLMPCGYSGLQDACYFLEKLNRLNIYPVKVRRLINSFGMQSPVTSVINITEDKNYGLTGYAGIGLNALSILDKWHQIWRTLL